MAGRLWGLRAQSAVQSRRIERLSAGALRSNERGPYARPHRWAQTALANARPIARWVNEMQGHVTKSTG
eukprot:11641969-Alexandrium_andersonii.AAC.1